MLKKISSYFLCFIILSGCSWTSSVLAPAEVVDAIGRGGSVSRSVLVDPPQTEEERLEYYTINAELWKQLEIWVGIKKAENNE